MSLEGPSTKSSDSNLTGAHIDLSDGNLGGLSYSPICDGNAWVSVYMNILYAVIMTS